MSDQLILLLSLCLPLVGAIGISLCGEKPNLRESITLLTSVTLLACIILLIMRASQGDFAELTVAEPIAGLEIAFKVEYFGLIFALIASSLWIVTTLYAIGYMRAHNEKNQTRFYTCFAIAIAAVMAIAFSKNLFTLFLFYEALTLSTYPLVTHTGSDNAKAKGRIYLGVLMGSSIGLLLLAILIVWHYSGTLLFTQGGVLQGNLPSELAVPLLALFVFGIGKAAVMPMHKWLPAAMVAPTPVSALLHAVAVVKAGVFSLLKIVVFIFGTDFITQDAINAGLIWLPLITILLASFVALTKDNIKERLAYSTISQLSYIVLGVLMANSLGMLGASMHIVMHAFAKISLFFAAGAILITTHKTKVSELDGLGKQMPITFTVFLIGTLSIIGLPPLGGMWSKWYLVLGAAQFDGATITQWAIIITLLLSSLLNIAYLGIIPLKGFFGKPVETENNGIKEAPIMCLIGLTVPALMCVYLFFYPQPFYDLALRAIQSVP